MNRRQFFAAPLIVLPAFALAVPSRPQYAVGPDWLYVGPYVDMGCLDMHTYMKRDESAYAILTYHRYADGQIYAGPFPAFEWDGPHTDMDWMRLVYPEAFREPPLLRRV